jgi:hypothetical protein
VIALCWLVGPWAPARPAQAPAAAPQAEPSSAAAARETVEVIELSVLADVPARRGTLGWDPVDVGDVELTEDGVSREVTEIEAATAADTGGSWRVLVWIDGERCVHARLLRRLEALGAAREELAALGAVQVVAADPLPRVLTGTVGWQGFAADVASRVRCRAAPREAADRLRAAGRPAAALAAWAGAEIARNDALLRSAGSATREGPALLVLLSEGYDLRPHLRWAERERPAGAEAFAERAAAATEELGRGLAEGGWTVLVPALDAPRSSAGGGVVGTTEPSIPGSSRVPMLRVWPRRSRGQMRPPAEYGVFLDFTLEPWRRVAALTAGGIATSAEDLRAALDEVRAKRRVWYRSARPEPGETRELRLALRHSDGQPIRAPALLPARWASVAVAATRARAGLNAASGGESGLTWNVRRLAQGWRVGLPERARIRWALVVPAAPDAPVPELAFHVAGLSGEVTLPTGGTAPPGAALYLEDLESGAWMLAR